MEITSPAFYSMDDFTSYFLSTSSNFMMDGAGFEFDQVNHDQAAKRQRIADSDDDFTSFLAIDQDQKFDDHQLPLQNQTDQQLGPKRPRIGFNSGPSSPTKSPVHVATGQNRRLWVKDRSNSWWERCKRSDFPEEEFKKAFRMSRSTFDMICSELDSVVTKKDTMLRAAIPVRQRVAVCIWRLATGEPLRLVSRRFGLGISTCHKLVLEVSNAIRNVLMPKFIQWPKDEALLNIKSAFESISGIPSVGGAMYTSHIPIIAPKNSVAAYYNKRHTERNHKTSYSMTVQGVVDHKGIFTDVCIGWPGSMPDDKVFEKSTLYKRATNGQLKDVWIVGNSGYPLMDGILAPYTRERLTWTQHTFNLGVGKLHNLAKDAFGRLKGRWSCLQKRTEVKLQELPMILGACCVLHNICEIMGDEMDPELKFDIFDDEMVPENNAVRSKNAEQARDHIAHNLLHHGLSGSTFF
ncbi:unnamed protein product [Rhodiola kirilowii]